MLGSNAWLEVIKPEVFQSGEALAVFIYADPQYLLIRSRAFLDLDVPDGEDSFGVSACLSSYRPLGSRKGTKLLKPGCHRGEV